MIAQSLATSRANIGTHAALTMRTWAAMRVREARAVTVGQTSDTQAFVYLRGKLWVRWSASFGTFVV